jgi:hypothetical protein
LVNGLLQEDFFQELTGLLMGASVYLRGISRATQCNHARTSLLFHNVEEKHLSEGFIQVLDRSFANILYLEGLGIILCGIVLLFVNN